MTVLCAALNIFSQPHIWAELRQGELFWAGQYSKSEETIFLLVTTTLGYCKPSPEYTPQYYGPFVHTSGGSEPVYHKCVTNWLHD